MLPPALKRDAEGIYIVLKQECILIVACQGFHHVTQHQNFFDPALCFFAALTRASRFFRLNCHHFSFFRFNYHPDFYSSLKSLHQMTENHLIELEIFIPYISACFHYLSASTLSTLYAYISIFISFYDHSSCLNAPVLAVLIIVSFMNFLILIQRVF